MPGSGDTGAEPHADEVADEEGDGGDGDHDEERDQEAHDRMSLLLCHSPLHGFAPVYPNVVDRQARAQAACRRCTSRRSSSRYSEPPTSTLPPSPASSRARARAACGSATASTAGRGAERLPRRPATAAASSSAPRLRGSLACVQTTRSSSGQEPRDHGRVVLVAHDREHADGRPRHAHGGQALRQHAHAVGVVRAVREHERALRDHLQAAGDGRSGERLPDGGLVQAAEQQAHRGHRQGGVRHLVQGRRRHAQARPALEPPRRREGHREVVGRAGRRRGRPAARGVAQEVRRRAGGGADPARLAPRARPARRTRRPRP